MTTTAKIGKSRVVIDFDAKGNFHVCSDPEVQVIVRCAHAPEDELFLYGHYPIPADWLQGRPIGFAGDGSEADKHAQLVAKAFKDARRA